MWSLFALVALTCSTQAALQLEKGGVYTITPQAWRQMVETTEHQPIAPVTNAVLDQLAVPVTAKPGNITSSTSTMESLRESLADEFKGGLDLPILLVMDAPRSQSAPSDPPGKEAPESGASLRCEGDRQSVYSVRIITSVVGITASAIGSISLGSASGLKVCCLLVCLLYLQHREIVGW